MNQPEHLWNPNRRNRNGISINNNLINGAGVIGGNGTIPTGVPTSPTLPTIPTIPTAPPTVITIPLPGATGPTGPTGPTGATGVGLQGAIPFDPTTAPTYLVGQVVTYQAALTLLTLLLLLERQILLQTTHSLLQQARLGHKALLALQVIRGPLAQVEEYRDLQVPRVILDLLALPGPLALLGLPAQRGPLALLGLPALRGHWRYWIYWHYRGHWRYWAYRRYGWHRCYRAYRCYGCRSSRRHPV
ncbi:flagellar hook-length control protein FliK [Geomicrobium sp. JCM 19038]|nr:flagellar hook-length control protein FliK [Geomicrobium sp. JCM 19038]